MESVQFADLNTLIRDCVMLDNRDGWKWALTSIGFSVASAQKYIDEHILHGGLKSTRWNRNVPIKVNVFMWRLILDKLPTMVNMITKDLC